MGLPSVRHSPLPLQSFLPLVDPQPPLPLQEFWPLQACFSFLLLLALSPLVVVSFFVVSPPAAWAKALCPATNPVRAAPISIKRTDFVICESPFLFLRSVESTYRTEHNGPSAALNKASIEVRTSIQNGFGSVQTISGGAYRRSKVNLCTRSLRDKYARGILTRGC